MSYIFLQEQGEASSADSFSDIQQYVLSRLNLTAAKSCSKDSETECCPNSQSGTTCGHSTADHGAGLSMSCVAASPAKTSAAQAKAQDLQEREADCGANLPASLAKYDPATHSWKTAQCSLLAGLDEFSETFPKWGMMRRGACWELPTLEHRTCANASGFWRTPECSKGGTISREALNRMANGDWKRQSGAVMQLRLQDQVREPRLYPTPNCSGMDGGSNSRRANKKRGIHQMFYLTPKASEKGVPENKEKFLKRMGDRTDACYPNLSTQVWDMEKKTYPTPTRSDYKSRGPNSKQQGLPEIVKRLYPTPKCQDSRAALTDRGKCNLGEVVHGGELTPQTKEARLNPNWVEWLMGWPIGWTDLKPLAMDKFRSWQQQHFNS